MPQSLRQLCRVTEHDNTCGGNGAVRVAVENLQGGAETAFGAHVDGTSIANSLVGPTVAGKRESIQAFTLSILGRSVLTDPCLASSECRRGESSRQGEFSASPTASPVFAKLDSRIGGSPMSPCRCAAGRFRLA